MLDVRCMRIIFSILLFLFANNLFAQDSIEVKRIDSFIEANEKENYSYDEITIVKDIPFSRMCLDPEKEKLISHYKFNNKHKLFKAEFFNVISSDTVYFTTYYFRDNSLIKIDSKYFSLILDFSIKELQDSIVQYYNNSVLIQSNKILNKSSIGKNLKTAKSIIKKTRKDNFIADDFFKYAFINSQ